MANFFKSCSNLLSFPLKARFVAAGAATSLGLMYAVNKHTSEPVVCK